MNAFSFHVTGVWTRKSTRTQEAGSLLKQGCEVTASLRAAHDLKSLCLTDLVGSTVDWKNNAGGLGCGNPTRPQTTHLCCRQRTSLRRFRPVFRSASYQWFCSGRNVSGSVTVGPDGTVDLQPIKHLRKRFQCEIAALLGCLCHGVDFLFGKCSPVFQGDGHCEKINCSVGWKGGILENRWPLGLLVWSIGDRWGLMVRSTGDRWARRLGLIKRELP